MLQIYLAYCRECGHGTAWDSLMAATRAGKNHVEAHKSVHRELHAAFIMQVDVQEELQKSPAEQIHMDSILRGY